MTVGAGVGAGCASTSTTAAAPAEASSATRTRQTPSARRCPGRNSWALLPLDGVFGWEQRGY